MTDGAAALSLDRISKRFGPTRALDDASLHVRAGSVHALLGENGAGKTTLMRIAFGLVQPDAGRIRVGGQPARFATPKQAILAGIGMVHQHFTIVPVMTVAENVALGGRGRFDPGAARARVRQLGTATGFPLDPDLRASELSVAAQQQLEILKALGRDARVLILDEPTAVLAPVEGARLRRRLRELARSGLAIVLITHKLRDAIDIADDITVLRRGRVALSAPAAMLDEGVLAREMLGAQVGPDLAVADAARRVTPTPIPVVRAVAVGIRDEKNVLRVRHVTLDVYGGEIIGIAGVEGAGVRELLRGLAGHLPVEEGTLQRPERIGFIPEDRHREALALSMSVVENVALHNAGRRRGVIRWQAFRGLSRALVTAFDIHVPGVDTPTEALSGRNQQRLVLARELSDDPQLLIAENPTRGLDPRATTGIHSRFRDARDGGMAIIFHSSDLDELALLADRVFAMHAGSLIPTARDRDAIGWAMLGGDPRESVPGTLT